MRLLQREETTKVPDMRGFPVSWMEVKMGPGNRHRAEGLWWLRAVPMWYFVAAWSSPLTSTAGMLEVWSSVVTAWGIGGASSSSRASVWLDRRAAPLTSALHSAGPGPGPGPGGCLEHPEQGFTWRIFPGGSVGKESAWNAGDVGLIPGLGRSPGGGHGSPLQYFCLENVMDRGAWQAAVHGLTKSQTQLSN